MNKKMALEVVGNDGSKYIFIVNDDPKYLSEWQANGINIELLVKRVLAGQKAQKVNEQ